MSNINTILKERGDKYGSFSTHAYIARELKSVVHYYGDKLDSTMLEALDMIMHKIARILNGDPEYADSWVDIAGYAQLVADHVEMLNQIHKTRKESTCDVGSCVVPERETFDQFFTKLAKGEI